MRNKITLLLAAILILPLMIHAKSGPTIESLFGILPMPGKSASQKARTDKQLMRKTQGTQTFPGTVKNYSWDVLNSKWNLNFISKIRFDGQGRYLNEWDLDTLLSDTLKRITQSFDANNSDFEYIEVKTGGVWSPSEIDTSFFDEHGNNNKDVTYKYDISSRSWVLSSGYIQAYTYDSLGNEMKFLVATYDSSQAQWVNQQELINTRNSKGVLQEIAIEQWANGAWTDYALEEYSYDKNGKIDTIFLSVKAGLGWSRTEMLTDTKWDSTKGMQLSHYVMKLWQNGSWKDYMMYDATYDGNGGSITTNQIKKGSDWVNQMRSTDTYDSHGNEIIVKSETWDGSEWVEQNGSNYNYTYDADGNKTMLIMQDYDPSQTAYVNTYKYVYTDFTTGINDAEQTLNDVHVYPNPTSDNLRVQVKAVQTETLTLCVYNLQGQVVMQGRYCSESLASGIELGVGQLQPGLYLLKISNGCAVASYKFIKN